MARITLYDTTLRDGAQTQGVDFSTADKVEIATALDQLGIDYIEGGWPGANPTDDGFFADPPVLTHARLAAFGMTRRAGRSAGNDPGLAGLINTGAKVITIVGKSWDWQVDVALGIERDENLAMISDSLSTIAARGAEPIFDAEHFFDGYKANAGYALACVEAAVEAGARWIVLCDTNGGSLPEEVAEITERVAQVVPRDRLGIHTHDDAGLAVANSLAAVGAGARMIQGTLNGLGERCGNANLCSLIPTLSLKMGHETAVDPSRMTRLTEVSRLLDRILNRPPARGAAYVGPAAFAHKGGLHVSAVVKAPHSYEHIEPAKVGNMRQILVSDQAGRSNILQRLDVAGIEVPEGSDAAITQLVQQVKDAESQGYSYDGVEASFELLARRAMGQVPGYFATERFRVIDERRHSATGQLVTGSEATLEVKVGGQTALTVATGNGPVNALDAALRKAVLPTYPELDGLRLEDYRVRILTPTAGTGAVTRVTITSRCPDGEVLRTIGVSANIIEASYEALRDSIVMTLLRRQVACRRAA
ncbi:MAG: citramalate synthase [Alphaproteobacteria bacterium]